MYLIEKTINKLYSDGYTFFLNPKELSDVTNHLKKNSFHVYKPYINSEKNILYLNEIPEIILLEIIVSTSLRHQDILGSLYNLGIQDNLFGDILITNNHYYFYTFKKLKSYFDMEFTKIKSNYIKLVEKDFNNLQNYEPKFEKITIINSSLRIDSVIAKLSHTNRDNVKEMIRDKKIMFNYDILKNNTKILQEGDTFSIRKIGKFQFVKVISNTKKNNLILLIKKYLSE